MVKINNKRTISVLTGRFIKINKKRNIIAVIAISLSALLFTVLFVGSESLILSKRAMEIREYMDSSHSSVQDLTEQEANNVEDILKNDKDIDRFGESIFLGSGMNQEFSFSTEVRYADGNMAESFNSLPTEGHMPEKENEIVTSTVVLDALGIPHELGSIVELRWEKNPVTKEYQKDTFVLSGYFEGDKAILAQMIWVSRQYAEKNRYPVTEEEIDNGIYNGGIDYSVWFKNLFDLHKKTDRLSDLSRLEGQSGFLVNPAYELFGEDSFPFLSVVILILFIIIAGYLIIYNIFSISVKSDIHIYALLKSVGTTSKQLKRIVLLQAFYLSIIGIPVGLFVGYITGVCMAPALNADIAVSSQKVSEVVVNADPIVFALAAFLTLITVHISCLRACSMVKKVSPIEALKMSNDIQIKRRITRGISVSWYGMGIQNMWRNRKKGIVVMISIALSLVVVNCIVILVQGYDFDSYKKMFLASDFQIDQMTSTLSTTNFDGVDPTIKTLIEECPYSENIGYVYYSDEVHDVEPHLMGVLKEYSRKYEQYWSDYEKELWENVVSSNKISVHLMGINKTIFDKLEWKNQKCEWEDFVTGDYVIVDYSDKNSNEPTSYYKNGDEFYMKYKSGSEKKYEILGEATLPYAIDYPYSDIFYLSVLVPEEEYIDKTGNDCAMYATIDAKVNQRKNVERYIKQTITKQNDMINVFSILDMEESFQNYVNKYYDIGAILVAVLSFIGIMNFFNTITTSVFSRKKELTLLEIVGMTKKQIEKMLMFEGIIYLSGAFLIAIALIYIGAEKLLASTVGIAFFFHMHLTILPCICLLPILFILAIFIPKYQFRKMCTESIVDRIRME